MASERRMAAQKANALKSAEARRAPKVVRTCVHCASPFSIPAWRLKGNPALFCTNKCRYAHKRAGNGASAGPRPDMQGDKHPSWRGGKSSMRGDGYTASGKHRAWRRRVLARDNFCCQKCGDAERLEAHHITPWPDSESLRFVVDNGITLCGPCHDWVHSADNPGYWLAVVPQIPECIGRAILRAEAGLRAVLAQAGSAAA